MRKMRSLLVATIIWFIFTQHMQVIGTYKGNSKCCSDEREEIKQFDIVISTSFPLFMVCIHLPVSVLMKVSFLWGKVQHYHGINFWTEDRFDYICLLVYRPQIKHTIEEFRRWSKNRMFETETIEIVHDVSIGELHNKMSMHRNTYGNHQHIWIGFPFNNTIGSMFGYRFRCSFWYHNRHTGLEKR